MSEPQSRAELIQAVAALTQALDLLSLRVDQLERDSNSTAGWEVVEPANPIRGAVSARDILLEEGPVDTPPIGIWTCRDSGG